MIKNFLNHNVIKNILSLSVLKVLDIILPLLTIPYLTRILSIDEFGFLIISIAIYSLATILTDFGFDLSVPYEIAKNRNNKIFINKYLSSIFIIKLFLFMLSVILIAIYYQQTKNHLNSITSIILTCAIVLSFTFQIPSFFVGIEKMKAITLLSSISKLLYFAMVFLFVPLFKNVESVLFSLFFSNIIASFFYILLIYKEGVRFQLTSVKELIFLFKENIGFFISRVSVSLSTTFNNALVGTMFGNAQAAIYGTADKLYSAGMSLLYPISTAIYPYITRTKNFRLLFFISTFLFVFSVIFCLILSNYSGHLFLLIFGEKYISASYYFNLMLFLVPINVVSILFGYPAFAIVNKPQIANYTVIISSILYASLFFLLFLLKNITIVNIIYTIIVIDSITLILRLTLFYKLYSNQGLHHDK